MNYFKKGYFDCERDGFGPVIENEEVLISCIEGYILNNIDRSEYIKRSGEFFPLYDQENSKRNYYEIVKI